MTFFESFATALFLVFFVFFVLALLYVLIRSLSAVLGLINQAIDAKKQTVQETPEPSSLKPDEGSAFGGTLRLQDVDEPTAAMVMAIVSDESGIPLSQLCFKSIKAISNSTKMEAKA